MGSGAKSKANQVDAGRGGRAASRDVRDLCEALLALESVDQCRRFLADLCTPGELRALADRWLVVRLLERGEAYRRIYEKTGVSTATVTRVARALEHGEGGYRAVLSAQDRAPRAKAAPKVVRTQSLTPVGRAPAAALDKDGTDAGASAAERVGSGARRSKTDADASASAAKTTEDGGR